MLYKIHNPRPATQGIWVSGQRVMVRSGSGLILEMGEDDAQQARKRVELSEIRASFSDEPERIAQVEFGEKPDTFAHEFIADINRLQAERVEFQEVEPATPNFDTMTDDQLRDYARSLGLKIHHKAGRAKILEALQNGAN